MKEKIIKLMQTVAERSDTPEDDENLFDSGFLNSFQLTDLIEALEKEFGVKIPDEDIRPGKFSSITKVEDTIASLQ